MIVKILGILDLIGAICLVLLKFGLAVQFSFFIGIVLFIKALAFIKNFVSVIDIIALCFFAAALFGYWWGFSWLAVLWFIQKAFFSFVA